jgi:hypothetical protein
MIDELRAVIGMKAENLEGELGDCFLQGGLEMGVTRATPPPPAGGYEGLGDTSATIAVHLRIF